MDTYVPDGLDELDQKIIQLLIENARISYSDIGKETGISRVAVKARIQALEKKGIICQRAISHFVTLWACKIQLYRCNASSTSL